MLRHRRLIAVVCVVVLFAAAMAPLSSSARSICAILVPLPLLFGAVGSTPRAEPEPAQLPSLFTAAPLPSRAPPLA
jgi:hypothetical protein